MYVEKFLQQVHRKLNEQGIANAKLRDTCIDIYEGENEIFKIDREGGMFYASDNRFRDVVDRLHEIIQPIVCEVDEYLRAMENGTELKARDFDMPYIKIAEYNEVEGGELVDNTWIYEEDTTLYAQWTLKGTRTLTFACDGGSYIRPITRKLGETIDLAGYVPEKQGYIFKGWYEDPRTKENEVTEYTFNGNGVLYAKWEADPTKEQPDTLMSTDTIYLTDEQYISVRY